MAILHVNKSSHSSTNGLALFIIFIGTFSTPKSESHWKASVLYVENGWPFRVQQVHPRDVQHRRFLAGRSSLLNHLHLEPHLFLFLGTAKNLSLWIGKPPQNRSTVRHTLNRSRITGSGLPVHHRSILRWKTYILCRLHEVCDGTLVKTKTLVTLYKKAITVERRWELPPRPRPYSVFDP